MTYIKTIITLSILLFIFSACDKENTNPELIEGYNGEFLSYDIKNYDVDVDIDKSTREISVKFSANITCPDDAVAEFSITQGAYATVNEKEQLSGVTKNDLSKKVIYALINSEETQYNEWSVLSCNNNYSVDWGLGRFLKESVHLNRSYSWYIDQYETGEFNFENCGPSSTTMAAKWSNKNFNKSAEDARNAYRPEGGWWHTSDIDKYLSDNNIPHHFVTLGNNSSSTQDILLEELDAGNIMILCVDMYHVSRSQEEEYRVDKFYNTNSTGWGHFIVVKGYQYVDSSLFFEIYDPYSMASSYLDNSLKGKNRYYRSNDIFSATSNWWNYAICVSEYGKMSKSKNSSIKNASSIPVKWGGANIF